MSFLAHPNQVPDHPVAEPAIGVDLGQVEIRAEVGKVGQVDRSVIIYPLYTQAVDSQWTW